MIIRAEIIVLNVAAMPPPIRAGWGRHGQAIAS
jgi:hypothetical protein